MTDTPDPDALVAQVAALREALERIKANVEWAEEGREIAMVAGHVAQIAADAISALKPKGRG